MKHLATARRNTPAAPRHKQKGMTLIEMGVVIILILIVMALASGRVGAIFGKNEQAEEVAALTQLIVNTKSLRSAGGYGSSGSNLVPALIATDGVPKSMPIQSNTLRNTWGQTVTVVSTGLGFAVTTSGVPKAACVEVANKVSRGGAMQTKVNSSPLTNGEVSSIDASTQCSSDDDNTIGFTVLN